MCKKKDNEKEIETSKNQEKVHDFMSFFFFVL